MSKAWPGAQLYNYEQLEGNNVLFLYLIAVVPCVLYFRHIWNCQILSHFINNTVPLPEHGQKTCCKLYVDLFVVQTYSAFSIQSTLSSQFETRHCKDNAGLNKFHFKIIKKKYNRCLICKSCSPQNIYLKKTFTVFTIRFEWIVFCI